MSDNILRQHFYIALAFQTLVLSRDDLYSTDASKRVIKLAQQISDFCNLYAPLVADMPAVNLVDEIGTEEIDAVIEAMIKDRREDKPVTLTVDQEMQLKLYDRLQHRAVRRVNRRLFAQISAATLYEHILNQIDVEIKERGPLS